ncbi:hypothetical protein EV193_102328 [Herbihabitans rhizosphaerae]|uniref:Uncharacterized protein n=1 Tax=Herbihabitans rhizosphaerae TaxID=1872711 RepID=A0A4Q7L1G5_9PSEU|nr:hypothetical protein [Herbihabitans rhizosphaerae]RZS43349.1 hypothetical protein EV193_102328 [Herbihabitans rhizosphaerae]
MALYRHAEVSVESWVEMAEGVSVSYDVDHLNDQATLYFGHDRDYVLTLGRSNLEVLISLAGQAVGDLQVEDGESGDEPVEAQGKPS